MKKYKCVELLGGCMNNFNKSVDDLQVTLDVNYGMPSLTSESIEVIKKNWILKKQLIETIEDVKDNYCKYSDEGYNALSKLKDKLGL